MYQYIYFKNINPNHKENVEMMLEQFAIIQHDYVIDLNCYVFLYQKKGEYQSLINDLISENLENFDAYISPMLSYDEIPIHLQTFKEILKKNNILFQGLLLNLDILKQSHFPYALDIKSFILGKYEKQLHVLKTIKTYLKMNQNAMAASKELFLHRNTLLMRIEKFQDITGLNVREFIHGHYTYLLLS